MTIPRDRDRRDCKRAWRTHDTELEDLCSRHFNDSVLAARASIWGHRDGVIE